MNGTMATLNSRSTLEGVQDYYGKVLKSSKDLKTSACTASGKPHATIQKLLGKVPDEVLVKFYGCGSPLPLGIDGLQVLDLGSGSGRDCYLAAALVGERGSVVGVDMTEEQNEVARRHVQEFTRCMGYKTPNMRFVTGHIEYLDQAGISDESVDLIISNCVVNLSPDKERVLAEAFRVLRPGGEMYFSDVYSDRRLSAEAQADEVLWGECVSGALYTQDFLRIAKRVGFEDPRVVSSAPLEIKDPAMLALLGPTRFTSQTVRLFKLPGLLESACEDYGQYAIYKGSIPGQEHQYVLDQSHVFEAGKPALVCGNTAAMLGEGGISWLAPHFQVVGDRSRHFGLFACGPPAGAIAVASAPACAPEASCC